MGSLRIVTNLGFFPRMDLEMCLVCKCLFKITVGFYYRFTLVVSLYFFQIGSFKRSLASKGQREPSIEKNLFLLTTTIVVG